MAQILTATDLVTLVDRPNRIRSSSTYSSETGYPVPVPSATDLPLSGEDWRFDTRKRSAFYGTLDATGGVTRRLELINQSAFPGDALVNIEADAYAWTSDYSKVYSCRLIGTVARTGSSNATLTHSERIGASLLSEISDISLGYSAQYVNVTFGFAAAALSWYVAAMSKITIVKLDPSATPTF